MWNKLFRKKDDDEEFEARLSEIDAKIRKSERILLELQRREALTVTNLRWYGALLYLAYLLWYYIVESKKEKQTKSWWIATVSILLIPLCLWYLIKAMVWFYRRKQHYERLTLAEYQKRQKETVHELKTKTKFTKVKNLLDTYDDKPTGLNQPSFSGLNQRKPPPPPYKPPERPMGSAVPQHPTSHHGNHPNHPNHVQNAPRPMTLPPARSPSTTEIVQSKQWYDKLFDAIIGPVEAPNKYALICSRCFRHNGLVPPEEYEGIQFRCKECGFLNSKKKSEKFMEKSVSSDGEEKKEKPRKVTVYSEPLGRELTPKASSSESEEEEVDVVG